MDVVVIGAGAAGIRAALAASEEGAEVLMVAKKRKQGLGSHYRSGFPLHKIHFVP